MGTCQSTVVVKESQDATQIPPIVLKDSNLKEEKIYQSSSDDLDSETQYVEKTWMDIEKLYSVNVSV